MFDNQIYQILFPILENGLAAAGLSGIVVTQSYQPTQQGANTATSVYIYKIYNHPYGWPRRQDRWDALSASEVHQEEQWDEATFQVNAWVTEDPADDTALTASDIVNTVRNIMQSDVTREALNASSLGILRPSEVRNPQFKDDRDNFESAPNFDFTLTDSSLTLTTTPVVNTFVSGFYRV